MATASDNVDMASPVVKGPGGKTVEFFEGMEQHFRNLYGEWGKDDDGTVMCPPFFARDYISPVGDVSGAAPLKDNVLATIKGDDAEEKIFDVLKEFGEKTKQPMFVLSKLKFTEFIKHCLPSKLTFPEFIKYCFQQRPADEEPKRFQVELDFVIVHLNIGVILIEVKAADKWPDKKAFNQLQQGERVIKAGLLQGESGIPVYKVIALPNMDGSGYCKDDFVSLKKSDVGSCDEFSHWMKAHFIADKCGSQEKQELLTMLYKLVGQRTKVGSSLETIKFSDHEVHPDKVLSKYYKNICSQDCLKQSFDSQNAKIGGKKRKADGSESCLGPHQAVVKTADELAEQVVFINPEQLRVWEGPCHQLISGAPGSGKTILLQCRALECARRGEKVIICVPVHLRNLYNDFFMRIQKNKEVISSGVKIYTFVELCEQSELLPVNEEKFHLFVDELQLLGTFNRKDCLGELTRKQISLKTFEMCYCWFAFDDSQIVTSRDPHDVSDTPLLDYSHHVKADNYIELYGLSQSIAKPHLKTVMRSTKHIFEFVRDYAEKHELYLVSETAENHSQAVADSIKRWRHQIGHRIIGDRVDERTGILEDVVEIIKTEIKTWKKKNVAVLVTCPHDLEYLSHRCNALTIPVCGVRESEDAVVVDYGGHAESYEWPVVIAVDLTSSKPDYLASTANYLIYSRAVIRLIVVKPFSDLQPLQEQLDHMLKEHLDKSLELLDLEQMDSIQSDELLSLNMHVSLLESLILLTHTKCLQSDECQSLQEQLDHVQQQSNERQSLLEQLDRVQQNSSGDSESDEENSSGESEPDEENSSGESEPDEENSSGESEPDKEDSGDVQSLQEQLHRLLLQQCYELQLFLEYMARCVLQQQSDERQSLQELLHRMQQQSDKPQSLQEQLLDRMRQLSDASLTPLELIKASLHNT